ncbi:MAG: sulfite exporter TauE/SafE family protein [Planctomycetota bacterium]
MTTIIIGAIIVGLILGLLGSGGSAIMVPILVYLVGHDAKISIAESMAIVGAISAVGAIPFTRAGQVDWQSVFLFGIPAMAGTFVGAWLGGLASDAVQLTVFGVVLLLAASLMIRNAFGKKTTTEETSERPPLTWARGSLILVEGLVVGALTGFVGVGGGFLIVPALLLLGKLPMRTAIGTSLVIISMKSAVGFLKYQHILAVQDASVDWPTILIFVAVGMVGCFAGRQLNSRLDPRTLKQVFAVFLILLGGFVIVREGSALLQPSGPSTTAFATLCTKPGKAIRNEPAYLGDVSSSHPIQRSSVIRNEA